MEVFSELSAGCICTFFSVITIAFYHGPIYPDLIANSQEFQTALEVYNAGLYRHAMPNMDLFVA